MDEAEFYILDEAGQPMRTDERTWAEWFSGKSNYNKWHVLTTRYYLRGLRVYTKFTGITTDAIGLWATVVYEGQNVLYSTRHQSKEAALKDHKEVCKLVMKWVRTGIVVAAIGVLLAAVEVFTLFDIVRISVGHHTLETTWIVRLVLALMTLNVCVVPLILADTVHFLRGGNLPINAYHQDRILPITCLALIILYLIDVFY